MVKRVFIDVETTGLILPKISLWDYHDEDSISYVSHVLQVAWVVMDDDQITKSETYYISPLDWEHSRTLSEDAFRVHGISKQICMEQGKRLQEVMSLCLYDMKEADFIIAHNIGFDMKLLMASFWRAGLGHISCSLLQNKTFICTRRGLTREIRNKIKETFPFEKTDGTRLTLLHKFLFENDYNCAHDALGDVFATMKCYFELIKNGHVFPFVDFTPRSNGQATLM